jgi:hypothetical protein
MNSVVPQAFRRLGKSKKGAALGLLLVFALGSVALDLTWGSQLAKHAELESETQLLLASTYPKLRDLIDDEEQSSPGRWGG